MTALGKLTKKRHAQRNESTQKRLKRVLATTHADFKDTFPFLALPAELRNAVYEYCCSEALVTSNSGTQIRQEEHYNGAIQLLHVNRQIRTEFRPVFLEAFQLRARLEHLPAIVQLIEGTRGSPSGTVVVDTIGQETSKRSINIAPFLRFCKTHNNVKFEIALLGLYGDIFAPPSSKYIRELNVRMRTDTLGPVQKQEVKWAVYFDKAVKEIWVTPRDHILVHHRAHFRVVVKPSWTEWWMGWSRFEPFTRAEAPPNLLKWKDRTGYPGPFHKDLLHVCGTK